MELKLPINLEDCHKYIKEQDIQLRKQGELLQELFLCIKKLEAENLELKELLNINSQNSSKPPSQDNRKNNKPSRPPSNRSSGGQKGHKRATRKLLDEKDVDKMVICELEKRCRCGGKIIASEGYQRHQVYELPEIKLEVTEYHLPKGTCQCCGREHMALLPDGITWGMTGHRLTGFMSSLTADYQLSRMDVKRFLKDHLNFSVSEGLIYKKEKIVTKALEEPAKNLLTGVKQSSCVNMDETSHYRNGKKEWMWCVCSTIAVHFAILASRGKKAMQSLMGDYEGILITDRYAVYNDFEDHQVCWAHLKRDFTRLSEKKDKIIGRIGKALLKQTNELFNKWHLFRNDKFSRWILIKECLSIRKQVGELLEQASYTDPKLKAVRFAKNLLTRFDSLWVFLENEGVEPTNNHAERCLRKNVIWRKKYFETKSEMGSLFVSRTASIIMTCRLQMKNASEHLTSIIKSYFSKTAPPLFFSS
jgi:transposase